MVLLWCYISLVRMYSLISWGRKQEVQAPLLSWTMEHLFCCKLMSDSNPGAPQGTVLFRVFTIHLSNPLVVLWLNQQPQSLTTLLQGWQVPVCPTTVQHRAMSVGTERGKELQLNGGVFFCDAAVWCTLLLCWASVVWAGYDDSNGPAVCTTSLLLVWSLFQIFVTHL